MALLAVNSSVGSVTEDGPCLDALQDVLLSSRDVTFESLRLFVIECVYRAQMAGHDGESDVLQLFIDQLLTANLLHDEAMVVSLCHRFQLPLAASRRTLFECVRNLPTDLGPAAVGLSKQFVKQLDVQESAQVNATSKQSNLVTAMSTHFLFSLNSGPGEAGVVLRTDCRPRLHPMSMEPINGPIILFLNPVTTGEVVRDGNSWSGQLLRK